MKVVPHRPYYDFFCGLTLTILFAVALFISGHLGHDRGIKTGAGLFSENRQLQQLYTEKKLEAEALAQRVANLELGLQVDRKAGEDIHAEMVFLKARVAELERETTFYRELMNPNSDNSGLTIGSLDIERTKAPRLYKYQLLVKQLAAQHQLLKGYLEFNIVGNRAPDALEDTNLVVQKVALKDISKDVSVVRMPLQFKYFQRFEGEFELPIGFQPEHVEIKAVSTGRGGTKSEKKFSWSVQEN